MSKELIANAVDHIRNGKIETAKVALNAILEQKSFADNPDAKERIKRSLEFLPGFPHAAIAGLQEVIDKKPVVAKVATMTYRPADAAKLGEIADLINNKDTDAARRELQAMVALKSFSQAEVEELTGVEKLLGIRDSVAVQILGSIINRVKVAHV